MHNVNTSVKMMSDKHDQHCTQLLLPQCTPLSKNRWVGNGVVTRGGGTYVREVLIQGFTVFDWLLNT